MIFGQGRALFSQAFKARGRQRVFANPIFFTVAHPFVRWKAEFSENCVGNLKNVVK